MKTVIVNAGPRKNWNTSKMLNAAKDGAEAAGIETEYVHLYKKRFEGAMAPFKFLNGEINIYPSFDTLQVSDYSKYEMASFNEEHKRERNETEFLKDLDRAYAVGKRS